MRILLVHDHGVLAGGSERITADLRDGLRARGHDVRLFASTARPAPLENEADYICFGTSGWPQRLIQILNPSAMFELTRTLSDFRPEIVHVRMFFTQLSPRILPLLESVPSVLHLGGQQTVCPLNSRLLPNGSRCTYRPGVDCYRQGCVSLLGLARTSLQQRTWRAHRSVFRRIVANSQALARTLRENDVRVDQVVYNGTMERPARPRLSDPPTIAFAGRLDPRKGVAELLRAVARIDSAVPELRVVVAGDGSDRARLDALSRELGLVGRVTFCGHLGADALDAELRSAWVQVAPANLPEPSPNVIPEAMMRGTAVVATAIGGSPELVDDGKTGALVPVGDLEALASALLAFVTDRPHAERCGAAARARALAEFTTARMLDRWEAIYAGL